MDKDEREKVAGYLGRTLQGKVVEWVHPSDKGGFTVRFMDGDEMDLGESFNLRRYPPFKVETPDETIERLKGG